jgi:hypothetical protein
LQDARNHTRPMEQRMELVMNEVKIQLHQLHTYRFWGESTAGLFDQPLVIEIVTVQRGQSK